MSTPSVLMIGINYAPEPTGIGPYTAGMAEGLAKRGWEVSVITGYPHYPWWRVPPEHTDLPTMASRGGVTLRRRRHYVPQRHSQIARVWHELTFGARSILCRWKRPDVVVLVSPALLSARIASLKARALGIPVITWVQDIYTLGVRDLGAGMGTRLITRWERDLANSSSRVVVIHERFRRMLKQDLDVVPPIDIVRNWSHVPDLHGRRDASVRAAYGWADDDVIVLHAGAIGAKQGLESVIRASRLAADSRSPVRFVLLGDGNRRAELEAMDANPNLQFIDPLPDPEFHALLASADVLLVNERPGMTEMSVPSKMTTYFATGLPIIAAIDESSTTFDEMTASEAGICVPPADEAALLLAAERLGRDRESQRTFGASAMSYRARLLTHQAALDAFTRSLEAAIGFAAAPVAPAPTAPRLRRRRWVRPAGGPVPR